MKNFQTPHSMRTQIQTHILIDTNFIFYNE